MKKQIWLTRALIVVTAFALCGVPEVSYAFTQEAAGQPAATQQDATAQQPPAQQPSTAAPQTQQRGTSVDPSQGPLTPVPTQTPDATSPEQNQVEQPSPAPPNTTPATMPQRPREPVGAAAAEGVRTEGGGASRPGGTAIAPAKQRQVRSFLVKLGVIAAAGVAVGTVYALSKGTSSTPPNSGR